MPYLCSGVVPGLGGAVGLVLRGGFGLNLRGGLGFGLGGGPLGTTSVVPSVVSGLVNPSPQPTRLGVGSSGLFSPMPFGSSTGLSSGESGMGRLLAPVPGRG